MKVIDESNVRSVSALQMSNYSPVQRPGKIKNLEPLQLDSSASPDRDSRKVSTSIASLVVNSKLDPMVQMTPIGLQATKSNQQSALSLPMQASSQSNKKSHLFLGSSQSPTSNIEAVGDPSKPSNTLVVNKSLSRETDPQAQSLAKKLSMLGQKLGSHDSAASNDKNLRIEEADVDGNTFFVPESKFTSLAS